MTGAPSRPAIHLVPVTPADEAAVTGLLAAPDLATFGVNAPPHLVSEALAPHSATSLWWIETSDGRRVGLAGLQPPSAMSLQLRAIGWRSREVVWAMQDVDWSEAKVREMLDALALHAGGDGVTFALIACVADTDAPRRALFQTSGFQELGRVRTLNGGVIVYERPV